MPDHGINTFDRLKSSMTNKLGSLSSDYSEFHIYTVPNYLRKGKEECYEPLIISIGPVFYKDSKLETMQDLKWKFLKLFLQHPNNAHRSLDHYLTFVEGKIADIRVCYQHEFKLSDIELTEMIVLDASFLIYLFTVFGNDRPALSIEEPPIIKENPFLSELLYWVGRDLFLEENQLPFFVLTGMYDVAFGCRPRSCFVDLALVYISKLVSCIPGEKAINSIIRGNKITEQDAPHIKHLVDLRRKCCCLSFYKESKDQHQVSKEERILHQFPTAKQLSAAGVKFKSNQSENPLDITFDKRNGVLKIPALPLYDATEPIIRSILFFERCNCCEDRYFTDYIFFLDRLINTVEDIQVLPNSEILGNVLGSDEDAVELFNNLTKYISYSKNNFAFSEVSKELKDYASTPWNRWKAILWSKYFNHPWAIISVSYAIVLLILTVLQTIAGFTAK